MFKAKVMQNKTAYINVYQISHSARDNFFCIVKKVKKKK
jgi:hypothetical protein